MENRMEREEDSVFHERPHMLATQGYRGFSVRATEQHWEGVKVTATNSAGKSLSAAAGTEHEALKKLIDQIDSLLDD